jgi:hypothetical protein
MTTATPATDKIAQDLMRRGFKVTEGTVKDGEAWFVACPDHKTQLTIGLRGSNQVEMRCVSVICNRANVCDTLGLPWLAEWYRERQISNQAANEYDRLMGRQQAQDRITEEGGIISAGDRARMTSRFLNRDDLDSITPPTALIEGVLDIGTMAVLAGKFGTYKTFLSLAWAASIATGQDWEGHPTTTSGPVLYVAAEGASGLRQRLRAWETENLNGERIPSKDFTVFNGRVNMADRGQVSVLVDHMISGGHRLLVIDTLHKCAPGLLEDSSKDMGIVINETGWIIEETGATVLFDHHTGHNGQRSRGSSSIEDDADTSWVIELDGEDRAPENERTLKHRKTKDRELLADRPLGLKKVSDSAVAVLDPIESRPMPWIVATALAAKMDDAGIPRNLTVRDTKSNGLALGIKASTDTWGDIARIRRTK